MHSLLQLLSSVVVALKQPCVCACSCDQLCPTLCNPMNFNAPGSSVHGPTRQEYCSGLPFPTRGDLPDPGVEHTSSASPASVSGFFITEPHGKP